MATPAQSVTLIQVLDGIQSVLVSWTGMDSSKLIEFAGNRRPGYEGEQMISYRLANWRPQENSGAARKGALSDVVLELFLWTVYSSDQAGFTYGLMRDESRGHWLRMLQIMNAFDNQNLFSAYDATTHEPTAGATKLTIAPMQQVGTPVTNLPKEDPSYAMAPFSYSLKLIKPLTV